jgi:hypothetical protein
VEHYNHFLTFVMQEGTSSRLMDLEDVVASNQAKLEDMLHNVHRQLHDIENAMGMYCIILTISFLLAEGGTSGIQYQNGAHRAY